MEIIFISFLIAFIISLYAGIYDLRTTEIPEEAPFLLVSFGLFLWFIYSLYTGDISYLLKSISIGLLLTFIGYTLYKFGQWGDGDAALLGGIGFLLPFFPTYNFFPLFYLFLLFLVGAIYSIVYAIVIGVIDNRVRKKLKDSISNIFLKSLIISILITSFVFLLFIGYVWINVFLGSIIKLSIITFVISFIFILFYYYAKIVENTVFIRRIKTSELKVGDVLYHSKKWQGLTKKDIERLKRKKKFVLIKEGVRFGPVFSISLLVSLFLKKWIIMFFPFLMFL
jgi:Flp pilus assembly protein protease CpaA